MDPVFLRLDQVLSLHHDQIERYGGSHGIRDMGMLQSAIGSAASSFGGTYLNQDVFEMAAAYLLGIVSNHPFIDGNKRAGAMSALVFLYINRRKLEVPEDEFETLILNVAKGRLNKADIGKYLRTNSRKA